MKHDILSMRRFSDEENSIDIAIPVLAVECEARLPLDNMLDAYEEAVLKLTGIEIPPRQISHDLETSLSCIEDILSELKRKNFTSKEKGEPWKITENGMKYLNGSEDEAASSDSRYGYMFINSVKKEVLPFFYHGDVRNIDLYTGYDCLKISCECDDDKTFEQPRKPNLQKAYKTYIRNIKIASKFENEEISRQEAEDLFADLECFDEADEEVDVQEDNETAKEQVPENENMLIRKLNKPSLRMYLRMKLIIDPSSPGGYRVHSPFDFGNIDDSYFLRQIQWLENSGYAYIEEQPLKQFLSSEICKISPSFRMENKSFDVFLLERMPLLKTFRSRFLYVYEDMERIYSLMNRQKSMLGKENIVNNISRNVLESLFNSYLRAVTNPKLKAIQRKAFNDLNAYGCEEFKNRICVNSELNPEKISWIADRNMRNILGRLDNTHGNSITEKFINMMIVEYEFGNDNIRCFLRQNDINDVYSVIDRLNQIRKKVSHDTNIRFTAADYDYYMANVFNLANSLLRPYMEG